MIFDESQISSVKVNLTRLNTTMARYASELKLAPDEIVRGQAGIIMRELADKAGPQNREKLERNIDSDIRKVYAPLPKKMLPVAHRKGHGFTWLMAGPNFVLGVKDINYHPNDSLEDMKRTFQKSKGLPQVSGKRYTELGVRPKSKKAIGRQHVMELNRIAVRRSVFDQFKAWLKKRVGILGGSWAIGWDAINPKGRKPQAFKFRHVVQGTARGTYINGIGVPGYSSFTIINRAAGVENRSSLAAVASVLSHRAEAMKVDIKNILKGAYKRSGWSKN